MRRIMISGFLVGFAIGFFFSVILVTFFQNQLTEQQSVFRQCSHSAFVLQTENDHSFGITLLAC